jgi:TfoX/Sxy family transcriptional regulator of competence genes
MALNEQMNDRIREALVEVSRVKEKRMFRGIAFMVNGKLCLSAGNDEMMCRIDPMLHEDAVQKDGVRPMVMKGRELKGYIYVHEDVMKSKREFDGWINMALDFNKRAKTSTKKKKKTVAKKSAGKPAKKVAKKQPTKRKGRSSRP